jgi:hypothetical protein
MKFIFLYECSADVSVHTHVLVLICTPFNKLLKIKLFFQKLTRIYMVMYKVHCTLLRGELTTK